MSLHVFERIPEDFRCDNAVGSPPLRSCAVGVLSLKLLAIPPWRQAQQLGRLAVMLHSGKQPWAQQVRQLRMLCSVLRLMTPPPPPRSRLSLKVGNLHKVKAEIKAGGGSGMALGMAFVSHFTNRSASGPDEPCGPGDLGADWSASLHPGSSRPLRAVLAPGRELVAGV